MSVSHPTATLLIEVAPKHDLIPVESFLRVVRNALDILRNIDLELSPGAKPSAKWSIASVSMNTPLKISLQSEPKTPIVIARRSSPFTWKACVYWRAP